MKSRGNDRTGWTLTEALLFSALAVLMGLFLMHMYRRGVTVTDETMKALGLQKDVRYLVELIQRDMASAFRVLRPEDGDPSRNLVLVKYASEGVDKRFELNAAGGELRKDFPFGRETEVVEIRVDAVRVSYSYDESKQQVTRSEDEGVFIFKGTDSNPLLATEYDFFRQNTRMDNVVIASHVKEFEIRYFGYERVPAAKGQLRAIADLEFCASMPEDYKFANTAVITLRLRSKYEEGVYEEGGRHHAPEFVFFGKFWSYPRMRDEIYREYFSSMDENLYY